MKLHEVAQTQVALTSVRTPPSDSTGVAHILEHTALCGSKRFPVRDPFFNMIKRSLNTYMNALTGSDHTMYPFSTTNAKDWRNLMSVYLDAACFPNLSKLDFLQEGHRVEINEEKDGEGELIYKGVVLNEMKGVLSDSNNLFGTRLQQTLVRVTIYEQADAMATRQGGYMLAGVAAAAAMANSRTQSPSSSSSPANPPPAVPRRSPSEQGWQNPRDCPFFPGTPNGTSHSPTGTWWDF